MTKPLVTQRSPVSPELEDAGVTRFGLIALATDLTSERDAWRVLPVERTALHVARVPYENPTTPENLARMAPTLTQAADLLVPGVDLAAICYSCTAASVEIGDAAIAGAIGKARPGVPVVTPPDAAVAAFAALGVGRIALVTPYLVETTEPMADYFTGRGLQIVRAQCLGMSDDREMARVSGDSILDAVKAADGPDVEGVFLSCTALPALSVIDMIEEHIGKPVVSSNQASFWQMTQHARLAPVPTAPGRLFRLKHTTRAA